MLYIIDNSNCCIDQAKLAFVHCDGQCLLYNKCHLVGFVNTITYKRDLAFNELKSINSAEILTVKLIELNN